MNTKVCTKCNISKPLDSFFNSSQYKDGKFYHCKACSSKNRNKNYHTKSGLIHKIYNSQKTRTKIKKFENISFSFKELEEWLLSSNIFNILFDEWVKSNYNSSLIPSCDRIDDYRGYSLDNLQITTWENNNKKYNKDCIEGNNTKMCKPVLQFDLNNNLLKEYFSLREASRQTNLFASNISRACKSNTNCGGYKWKYK